MKILIFTGHHDPMDAAIKFLTHGPACHAAFLRADGKTVHEAFYPRVRDRALTSADKKNAHVFELKRLTKQHHDSFEHLFDVNLKRKIEYSILDLFRYAFNKPSRNEHHTFCSRYVLYCCHAILPMNLMPLVRIPGFTWASPQQLYTSPRLAQTSFSAISTP